MKLAMVQTDIAWNEPAKNLETYEQSLRGSDVEGADLIAFPEMFNTGFSFPTGELAVKANSLGQAFLATTAKTYECNTVGSMPQVDNDGRLFNSAYVYSPDGLIGVYSKQRMIRALGEDKEYSPGEASLTIDVAGCRTSFLICYDLRFPELFSSLANDTDLYVLVANWPASRQSHWDALLKARAIENQAYVAGINRVGSGGGLDFVGGSQVISPRGELLFTMDDSAGVGSWEIDPVEVSQWRSEFSFVSDREELLREGIARTLQH